MTTSKLDFILKRQFRDLRHIIGHHYKKRNICQAHRKSVKQWIDAFRQLQAKTGFV